MKLSVIAPLALLVISLSFSSPSGAAGGGGGGGSGGGSVTSRPGSRSPGEIAESRYRRGLRSRDKALDFEAKAKKKDESWFGKRPSERAVDSWNDAVGFYQEAIEQRPRFYEAYSDLGYAYRKLGDYSASLAAYDRALRFQPDYVQAIEYRGEAYLRLLRLEDAQAAYMRLFVLDRQLADQLLANMTLWVSEVEAAEEGLSPSRLKAFRTWVGERAQLAGQTGGDLSDARPW
jgi:tetratricopeptide (TPR) repeat protein